MIYPEDHWFPPVGMGPAEDMITYRKVQHLCFLYTSGNSECELPRLLPKWCPTADGVRKWVVGREFIIKGLTAKMGAVIWDLQQGMGKEPRASDRGVGVCLPGPGGIRVKPEGAAWAGHMSVCGPH